MDGPVVVALSGIASAFAIGGGYWLAQQMKITQEFIARFRLVRKRRT